MLEHYWKLDGQDYYPQYGLPPHHSWFGESESGVQVSFSPGVGYFGNNTKDGALKMHFSGGRHRTRWLLESCASEVVIAVSAECVPAAVSAHLARKVLQVGSSFSLGFKIKEVYRGD